MTTTAVDERFAVRWERADDAELSWRRDDQHWPRPLAPLVFAVAGEPVARGLMAAAAAYDLPTSEVRIRRINTYRYQACVPGPRDRSGRKLRRAMAGLQRSWAGRWLPEVRQHLAWWEGFDLRAASLPELLCHLHETMARVERLWEIHFLLASPMRGAIRAFTLLLRELLGGSALDALRLLEGFDNETLSAGRALWALSRTARALPDVRATIEGSAHGPFPELERSAQGRAFAGELRAYLARHGRRGEDLDIERPSWIEDPTPVLEHLRCLVDQPDRALAAEEAATVQRRERSIAEARRLLGGYPGPVREEFEFLLRAAQEAVVLCEDHNAWIDARCMHRVRLVFLELGRRLVARGQVTRTDDVFYLTPGELDEACRTSPAGCRELVAERRAEVERFRSIDPPPTLGARSGARAAPPDAGGGPLRGQPCSSGTNRGRGRGGRSLRQAGEIRRGDILVTSALTSSWAPLFLTAGAVVAERGGILCHAAVVAREYGIPAVLDVARATSAIQDGQIVEVDGDGGQVRVIGT